MSEQRRLNTVLSHLTSSPGTTTSIDLTAADAKAEPDGTSAGCGGACACASAANDAAAAGSAAAKKASEDEVPIPRLGTNEYEGIGLRAKSRVAGMSGNYWYAVELDEKLAAGEVKEVVWWKTSIALWRGADGVVRAVENRCAHRQLRLTTGIVEGDNLCCQYHGWKYNGDGRVVHMSHEIPKSFKTMPNVYIRAYPVQVKYGVIFLFPGDPDLAERVPLPTIPWLDQDPPVPFRFVDVTIKGHYLPIIENNCDFYHAFLHREYRPFTWPELQYVERDGDCVEVRYLTDMQSGGVASWWRPKEGDSDKDKMTLYYDYPYQRSNLIDKYLHWLFLLPIDENTTRLFYVFLWGPISFAGIPIPYAVRPPLLWAVHKAYLIPLLKQDVWALEEEQSQHNKHWQKNAVELNPLVSAFQRMTVEKWEEYVASERARKERVGAIKWKQSNGAGLTDFDWASYK